MRKKAPLKSTRAKSKSAVRRTTSSASGGSRWLAGLNCGARSAFDPRVHPSSHHILLLLIYCPPIAFLHPSLHCSYRHSMRSPAQHEMWQLLLISSFFHTRPPHPTPLSPFPTTTHFVIFVGGLVDSLHRVLAHSVWSLALRFSATCPNWTPELKYLPRIDMFEVGACLSRRSYLFPEQTVGVIFGCYLFLSPRFIVSPPCLPLVARCTAHFLSL